MIVAKALLQEFIVPLAMIYMRGHLDSGGTISLNVRMTHSIIPRVIGPTLSHSQGPFSNMDLLRKLFCPTKELSAASHQTRQ